MTDIKVEVPVPKSRKEAEDLFALLAFNDSMLKRSEAELTKAATDARTKHEADTALIRETCASQYDALLEWAEANKKAEFSKPRFIETLHGKFGFGLSSPSLQLLSKETWETVLARLVGGLKKYTRPKVEVNKVAILAAAKGDKPKLTPAKLSKLGLKMEQTDAFFLQLKAN
jgi:phage host-nuclease inhibitor protein Gam